MSGQCEAESVTCSAQSAEKSRARSKEFRV